MPTTIWIGLTGALMSVGDMLLYYTPEDFTYGVNVSDGVYIICGVCAGGLGLHLV